MNFETLKGTKDLPPSQAILKEKIVFTIKNNFVSYGFRPLETPTIELLETLTFKYDSDAEIVQEIFKLSDRGDRELGLRYDLTIPLCRFISQNNKSLKLPFRRYQIGPAFRDGPVKSGRLREFIQCDADVIGLEGQEIEAELLDLFYSTYTSLGIDVVIKINSNNILRGVFLSEGFLQEELNSILLTIDKLSKVGESSVLDELEEKGFNRKKCLKLISVLKSNSFLELEKLNTSEVLSKGIEELKSLVSMITPLGINYEIDFSMSRGHSYYSGNIWEVYDIKKIIKSSIGAGGRYDKGISEYIDDGKIYPAVGISFGIVGIMTILEQKNPPKEGVTEILVCPLDSTFINYSFNVARKLRDESKKSVEVFYGFKLKKAFPYASYLGCSKLVIIGKEEFNSSTYLFKDLNSGEESKIKF